MPKLSVWVGVTDLTTGLPTFGSTDTPTYRIAFVRNTEETRLGFSVISQKKTFLNQEKYKVD